MKPYWIITLWVWSVAFALMTYIDFGTDLPEETVLIWFAFIFIGLLVWLFIAGFWVYWIYN